MGILDFNQPKKKTSTEKHNQTYMSDTGIAGTYVPNMSEEDKLKWKAKVVKGDKPRVEIRKTIEGTQVLIVVCIKGYFADNYNRYKDCEVKMSMNGPAHFSAEDFKNLNVAVEEAKDILEIIIKK